MLIYNVLFVILHLIVQKNALVQKHELKYGLSF